jgi:hypothetical protein
VTGPLQVIGPRNGTAPLVYQVSDAGIVGPFTVRATFDCSGAGGTVQPTLTFRSQDGTILHRSFPDDTIAAGSSAAVNYAPF